MLLRFYKLKSEEAIADSSFEIADIKVGDNNLQEAVSALQVLGYPQRDATKAVNSIDCSGLSVEEIIKKALLYFAKN